MGKSSSVQQQEQGGSTTPLSYYAPQERPLVLRPPTLKPSPSCRKRHRYNLLTNPASPSSFHGTYAGIGSHRHAGSPSCSPFKTKPPLLPPLAPTDQSKKTLVLDLDETLIHSSFKPIRDFDFALQVEMEPEPDKPPLQTVYVLKRPGVEDFLRAMAAQFEVVVFTAGMKQYADAVLDIIDVDRTIKHRLYRDSCRLYMGGLVKDLSTLGRDLRKVIIVDNSPHCYLLQPRNAVPIVSFIDNRDDHELLDLIPFLSVIAELDNVTDALGQM